MSDQTLILTARDVAAVLDIPSCIDAIERGFVAHEMAKSIGPTSLGLTLAAGSFHVKAAALTLGDRTLLAAKANINLPGNLARTGRPTIQGALILVDADTGHPLAVMDSMVLTSIRTGAVTAVAAKSLALTNADTATVVGCGEQGEIQLRCLAAVRELRRAFVCDVDEGRARRFAERLEIALGFPVQAVSDFARTVSDSQILVTCTTASTAFVEAAHLRPGLFVSAVGADNPMKHEITPRALAASRIVVDSLTACAANGDLHHAIHDGVVRAEDVHAELSAVIAGRAEGRRSTDEIFVLDSVGTAIQDVATAALVYARAREQGLGTSVPLGSR